VKWPKLAPGVGHRIVGAALLWVGLYYLFRAPEGFSPTLICGLILVYWGVVEAAHEAINRKLAKLAKEGGDD